MVVIVITNSNICIVRISTKRLVHIPITKLNPIECISVSVSFKQSKWRVFYPFDDRVINK